MTILHPLSPSFAAFVFLLSSSSFKAGMKAIKERVTPYEMRIYRLALRTEYHSSSTALREKISSIGVYQWSSARRRVLRRGDDAKKDALRN